MARIDDYVNAKKIAVQDLAKISFNEIINRTLFEKQGENSIIVPFLNRTYIVNYPSFDFIDAVSQDLQVPIQEQVIILHYMLSDRNITLRGKKIAYREIPGAATYHGVFLKRAAEPLKKVFGKNIENLKKGSEILKGIKTTAGDVGFEFYIFPKIPLELILWEGDDEFPAEANILFDESIGHILSPEDVAWLSGMLVYRLISIISK
ncbi:MAG: DUF3786 domain-containing protein [Desulfobacterales bacterium]|nr:DUF3786 domain-containing protein [Desulfobacterales bacterium]